MNIIKFNDIILSAEDMEQYEVFNQKFKGKYAYAVNWYYIVALEDITTSQYMDLSKDPEILPSCDYIFLTNIPEKAIDMDSTEKANSIVLFLAANKYTSDEDITLDELKKFRKWLATYLLDFDRDKDGISQYKLYDDETTHMLLYYEKDMYDSVIKYLSKFSDQSFTIVSTVSSCGCNSLGTVGGTVVKTLPQSQIQMTKCGCNTSAVSGAQAINGCDPIGIYRKNIYLKMVNTFSIIEFWTQFSDVFLSDFKKYVDGIIKLNLPLTTSSFVSAFADCGCLSQADAEQARSISILTNLSRTLQYMINKDIDGHKNFIQNTLREWSSMLYEQMRWE